MSDKKDTTHVLIDRQLVIFLRPRSAVWQCRYQVDKRWQRESTGEHELDKATKRAHDLLIEANVRKKLNVAPITRYFKDIAKLAVQRMDDELNADNGKVIYRDYKIIIEKYLVPFFGKYKVDSIDYKVLELFNEWRVKRMQITPKHSTLLNHNAALNRIFDEAELRNYLFPVNRPKLVAKGKKWEQRKEFNLEETRALVRNFDDWIKKSRADSIAVRALLKDYVITLLDTGARPGRELLCLTWAQVQQKFYPTITKTGEMYDDGEGNVEEVTNHNANRTVFLNIQESKTDKRIAVGRLPTAQALRAIAKRNYGKTLEEMLKANNTDAIFRFKEYLNEEEIASGKQPKLLTPTSFGKLFEKYLSDHNLLIDPTTSKKRVLYSLRHTYATLALTYDKTEIHTLAKQMGTSVAMIEKHYSHLDAVKAVHQLHGNDSRQLIEAVGELDLRYVYDEKK
jgi:integrase